MFETGSIDVAVTIWSIVDRSGSRQERLVVQRRIVATDQNGSCGQVTQNWISDVHTTIESTRAGIRRLCSQGLPLVRGEQGPPLPELNPADTRSLKNVEEMRAAALTSGGRIERLVHVRTVLALSEAEPRVDLVEVTAAPGSVCARDAANLGTGAAAGLQPLPARGQGDDDDDDPPPKPGTGCPDDLVLPDSRQQDRLERHVASVTSSPLEPDAPIETWPAPSRWSRRHSQPPTELNPDHDCVVITLISVDGAQIGERNKQVNLWKYELEPEIDLSAALRDDRVKQAFADYAREPHDAGKRSAAVDALRSVRTGSRTDWQVVEHQTTITRDTGPAADTLPGTIILNDCRGIQIGNRMRQYNTFSYVCAPTIEAHDLFRSNPRLVESIVDYACKTSSPGSGTIERQLSLAVCGDAQEALARPSGIRQLPAHSMTVEGGQGLTIGPQPRQVDKLEIAAQVSQVAKQIELASLAQEEARKLKALEIERKTRRLHTPSPEKVKPPRIGARRPRLPGPSL